VPVRWRNFLIYGIKRTQKTFELDFIRI